MPKTIKQVLWEHYADEGKHLPERTDCPECLEAIEAIIKTQVIQWNNHPTLSSNEYHASSNLKKLQEAQLREAVWGKEK